MNIEINKEKIYVTIPEDYTELVRNAICDVDAGIIGNYNYYTTTIKSIGTFIPNDSANPYIGENNKLEIVKKDKLEVVCDIKVARQVISELRKVHPYEEPGINIVPLIIEEQLI